MWIIVGEGLIGRIGKVFVTGFWTTGLKVAALGVWRLWCSVNSAGIVADMRFSCGNARNLEIESLHISAETEQFAEFVGIWTLNR